MPKSSIIYLAGVLGDAALLIEHVGSTSVPGLAAKPIIDILLVVEDSGDEASYLSEMEAGGSNIAVWPEAVNQGGPQIRAIRSGRDPLDDGEVRDIELRPGLFRISKNSRAVTPT